MRWKDVRCGVILRVGNQFLLVRERKSGLWGFVKGGRERGERFEATASRELKEEIDIWIPSEILQSCPTIVVTRCYHRITHVYFLLELKGKPLVTLQAKELIDFMWITLEELYTRYTMSYMTKQALRYLFSTA